MIPARTLSHAAAFVFLGVIALPVACGSDDDEKASASTGAAATRAEPAESVAAARPTQATPPAPSASLR